MRRDELENLYNQLLKELLDKGVPPMIAEEVLERMVNHHHHHHQLEEME